jgi:hypothetical protein
MPTKYLRIGFIFWLALDLGARAAAPIKPSETEKQEAAFNSAIKAGDVEQVKGLLAANPKLVNAVMSADDYLPEVSSLAFAYEMEYQADAVSDYDRKDGMVAENYRLIQKLIRDAGGRYSMSKENSAPNVFPTYWITRDPTFFHRLMGDIRDSNAFRMDGLEKILNDPAVKNSADVFKQLPPSFLKDSVVMTESFAQNRHLVKDSTPRIIVSNEFGDFAIGVHGNDLSRMELYKFDYNSKPKGFRLHEVKFAGAERGISKPNPAECAACHQKTDAGSFRPNFAPYFVWRGCIGQVDDELNSDRHPPVRPYAEEIEAVKKFLEIQKTHPLYSQLPDVAERFEQMLANKEHTSRRTHVPNVRFTANAYALNDLRIAEELMLNKDYARLKLQLLAIFGECLPEVNDKSIREKVLESLKGTPITPESDFSKLARDFLQLEKSSGSNFTHEGKLFKNWLMLHGPQVIGEGPMSRGTGGHFQFRMTMLFMHMDPELRAYFPPKPKSRATSVDCKKLQGKLDEIAGAKPHALPGKENPQTHSQKK